MTILRVHFDGKVLVPEGPVNLPRNTSLEVRVVVPVSDAGAGCIFGEEDGFPTIKPPPGSPKITLEDVQAALEEDI